MKSIGYKKNIIFRWKEILMANGFKNEYTNIDRKDTKIFSIGKLLIVSVLNPTGLLGDGTTMEHLQALAEYFVRMVTPNYVAVYKDGNFEINCPELRDKQKVVIGRTLNSSCRFFIRIDNLLEVNI